MDFLFGPLALLCLCALLTGCGSSGSTTESIEPNPPSAQEKRERRETHQVKRELANGNFVACGGQVFVNKRTYCAFAKNIQTAYYTEVISGAGKVVGLMPSAGKDYRVHCAGAVPHRCTGFEDDGGYLKPLKGALIFFSP